MLTKLRCSTKRYWRCVGDDVRCRDTKEEIGIFELSVCCGALGAWYDTLAFADFAKRPYAGCLQQKGCVVCAYGGAPGVMTHAAVGDRCRVAGTAPHFESGVNEVA